MSKHRRATGPRVVVPPLLNPFLPDIRSDAVAQLRSSQPYDFAMLQDVRRCSPSDPPTPTDTAIGASTSPPNATEYNDAFRNSLGEAQRALVTCVEEWLPTEYRARLTPLANLPEDPPALTALLLGESGGRTPVPRRTFEARRLLHLAHVFLHLHHESAALRTSHEASRHVWNAVMDRCFTPIADRVPLHSLHDPAQQHRCIDANLRLPRGSWAAREHVACEQGEVIARELRDTRGDIRPILFTMRVKNPFAMLLHMLRDNIPEPEWVMDVRGMRFVCFSHEDRLAVLETLIERFPRIPRTLGGWIDRYSRTAQRSLNRFAAGYFRTMKFYCHLDDQSGAWEVHIMHVHDYLNLWWSRGDENWYQYRFRQLLSLFFPRYFPTAIYNIPWRERRIHRTCREWIRDHRREFPAPQETPPHLRS